MTNKLFLLLLAALLLSACGPSQAERDAAVATQVALLMQQQAASQATVPPAPADQGVAPTIDPNASDLPVEARKCVPANTERLTATVTDVWSGDSFQVQLNGQSLEVRLIGIDAGDGPAGLAALTQLVNDKQVILIRDVTDVDQYGRLPRFVVVDNIFVNYELLRQGVVFRSAEDPDTSCALDFRDLAP